MIHDVRLILKMSLEDYMRQFRGALLGASWGFVQPIVLTLIWCIVFGYGLKAAPVNKYPFALWLVCGIIPYFYISEVLSRGANCFLEYSYLVKKIVFPIHLIPLFKLVSSVFPHVFFITISGFLLLGFGYEVSTSVFGLVYYFVCLLALSTPVLFVISVLNVFLRDISHVTSVVLQILVWVTPVFWSESMIPEGAKWLLFLNPLSYIVSGYRDCLLGGFSPELILSQGTLVFFSMCGFLNLFAYLVFSRLKYELADFL